MKSDYPYRSGQIGRMRIPVLNHSLGSFVAVDEGRDQIIRFDLSKHSPQWTLPLRDKCRSLQLINESEAIAVTDRGWQVIDIVRGMPSQIRSLFGTGVISVQRQENGNTFCGGLNLAGRSGVNFVMLDAEERALRSACFEGDYVRRSTLTDADTILFTCDDRVCEGTWSGKILREFSAPGFRHAWKAVRLPGDRTLITAGYGAFAVEFAGDGKILHRWECTEDLQRIRPHFFGDFEVLPDGGLLVCNWLGHGTDLGASGCPLLHFDPVGRLIGAWQDATFTSSLQTFVRLPPV